MESGTVRYKSLEFMGHPAYRVGDDGSVWSKKWGRWKKLTLIKTPLGHLYVTLYENQKGDPWAVHRLVLTAFVGPCPDGKIARHYPDQTPSNNRLENLSWGTWEQNNGQDKVERGTTNRGERQGQSKLTEKEVLEIRANHAEGLMKINQQAKKYKVSSATISNVIGRVTWKHI